MRTIYYNNQKFSIILDSNENFVIFIDFFFKDIFLYTIKIFPNINLNNKNSINDLDIDNNIKNSFTGETLPFIKNDNNIQIPFDILYNISDFRHDIMKDIINKEMELKTYFEKQEKYINNSNNNIYLNIIIFFLEEIKEKYFVERFIKYIEFVEEDKKIILERIKIK